MALKTVTLDVDTANVGGGLVLGNFGSVSWATIRATTTADLMGDKDGWLTTGPFNGGTSWGEYISFYDFPLGDLVIPTRSLIQSVTLKLVGWSLGEPTATPNRWIKEWDFGTALTAADWPTGAEMNAASSLSDAWTTAGWTFDNATRNSIAFNAATGVPRVQTLFDAGTDLRFALTSHDYVAGGAGPANPTAGRAFLYGQDATNPTLVPQLVITYFEPSNALFLGSTF